MAKKMAFRSYLQISAEFTHFWQDLQNFVRYSSIFTEFVEF